MKIKTEYNTQEKNIEVSKNSTKGLSFVEVLIFLNKAIMLTKIDGNSAHTINSVELICNLFIEYFLNCDNKIKMPHTKIR